MLSHVIPQYLVTDRITIKLQLTSKSRLIFKFSVNVHVVLYTACQFFHYDSFNVLKKKV